MKKVSHLARSEDPSPYHLFRSEDDAVVARALEILASRIRNPEATFSDPSRVKDYLRLKLHDMPYEVFGAIWLDTQNRVLDHGEVFRGTLSQTSVYPRELVKLALQHNAAAVVLYHNHPSGVEDASQADINLTKILKDALALVDVRVLDHFIVTTGAVLSFAERGLI